MNSCQKMLHFSVHDNYTIPVQVNLTISNMGNLEYPAYVEVDRRSRSYFLNKLMQKLRVIL